MGRRPQPAGLPGYRDHREAAVTAALCWGGPGLRPRAAPWLELVTDRIAARGGRSRVAGKSTRVGGRDNVASIDG